MSLQKDIKIIRQEWERHTVDKNSPWILGKIATTSKMGSQSASTATSMAI